MTNELLSILSLGMVLGVALFVGAISYINDRPREDEHNEREEA